MYSRPGVAEQDIIGHCKKGSLKHQEMLYKLFYGYAMGISLRYSFSKDDALEVVNDAFIKIFNSNRLARQLQSWDLCFAPFWQTSWTRTLL